MLDCRGRAEARGLLLQQGNGSGRFLQLSHQRQGKSTRFCTYDASDLSHRLRRYNISNDSICPTRP